MAKINFYAQKTDDDPMQWEDPRAIEDFRKNAKNGRWRFDAVLERKPKSQKQLGDIFGNAIQKVLHQANEVRQDGIDGLIKYLKQLDEPKNVEATDDMVKKVFYTVAPTFNDKGEEINLSKMDTKQAADFMKRVRDIMAGYVYIPDPDPLYKEKPDHSTTDN